VIAATSVASSVLRDALRVCAQGCLSEEVAVGLLIAHGTWLARTDFRTTCIDIDQHSETPRGPTTVADIDWHAARVIAAHAEADQSAAAADIAVLRVAASIAIGDLRTAAAHLDMHTVDLVTTALARAASVVADPPPAKPHPRHGTA